MWAAEEVNVFMLAASAARTVRMTVSMRFWAFLTSMLSASALPFCEAEAALTDAMIL